VLEVVFVCSVHKDGHDLVTSTHELNSTRWNL